MVASFMEAAAVVPEVPAVLVATTASEATEAMVTAPQKAMAETRTLLFERSPSDGDLEEEESGAHMVTKNTKLYKQE